MAAKLGVLLLIRCCSSHAPRTTRLATAALAPVGVVQLVGVGKVVRLNAAVNPLTCRLVAMTAARLFTAVLVVVARRTDRSLRTCSLGHWLLSVSSETVTWEQAACLRLICRRQCVFVGP